MSLKKRRTLEKRKKQLKKIQRFQPKNAKEYLSRGIQFVKLQEDKQALGDFNKAIKLEPNNAKAYNYHGFVYTEMEQYKEALRDFNKAIQLDPECSEAYFNRGLMNTNYEEALKDFDKAIHFNPDYIEAYYNRGLLLFIKTNQYEEALKDFNQAIQLNKQFHLAYFARGTIYLEINQHEKALKDLNQAIQLNPLDSQYYKIRAVVHIAQTHYTDAQIDFDHAIALSTSLKEKQTIYSIAYSTFLATQRFEEAKVQVEKFFNQTGLQDNFHKQIYLDNISKSEEIYRKNQALEKEYQAEVEESRKFKYLSSMATAIAHQINQPVGVIRAATSAALSDIQDDLFQPTEELEPLLDKIYQQTERLKNIIESFRTFARGDRQHREKVNLNTLIAQTIVFFEPQFKAHNIQFTFEKNDSELSAWINPFQVQEILINLLNNAKEALENTTHPQIWIKIGYETSGEVKIQVEDNGPGIMSEFSDKLFMPFESTKSTERGTGLGLLISRKVIETFGGTLYYQSRQEGGAIFTLTLPPFSKELKNG